MAVKKLQNVYLAAADMGASRHFYEAVIGLEPRFADGERWTQYAAAGGGSFAVAAPQECPDGMAGAVAVFEVDDLDAHAARLVAAGIPVLARRDMGAHGRVLTVRDPSGNLVQLFARAPAA